LILGLKINIDSNFSLISTNQDSITVCNSGGAYTEEVTNFAE